MVVTTHWNVLLCCEGSGCPAVPEGFVFYPGLDHIGGEWLIITCGFDGLITHYADHFTVSEAISEFFFAAPWMYR